jgi:DnaJ-class molecular chaperone
MKGDIKLVVVLENHPEFVRSGMDLVYKKKITLKEALCGFSFQIKHLNGNHLCLNNTTKRNIIKPNYRKIVPNLGFVKEGQSVGNLLIDFEIEFPDVLTEEQMDSLAGIL